MRKIFIILMLSVFSIVTAHPFKSEKELYEYYAEIDKKILSGNSKVRKHGNSVKSSLRKTEKLYNKYQENFDAYINSSRLKPESKEKIKKMIKFEKLSDLKFLIQSLKKPEVEENGQQQQQ